MTRYAIPGVAAAMLWTSCAALADGECDKRALTALEKKWVSTSAAAVKQALPPVPAGWVGIDPADIGLTYTNTQLARTPSDTCAEGGPYALEVEASAYLTPKGSALARRAEIGRKLAALRRQESQVSESAGATSNAAGATMGAGATDMMALQEELMAAQASGDGARMQRAMEKMQKATDSMTASTQQMNDQGTANFEQSSKLQQQDQALTSQYEALAGEAARAPVVIVTAAVNPNGLRAQPKQARALSASGAAQAWIESGVNVCFGDACTDKSSSAVALFGKLQQDFDNGQAVSYQPQGAVTAAAAYRAAMVTVEGAPALVEQVFKAVNFKALQP